MKIALIALENVVATALVGIVDYVDFTNSITRRVGGQPAEVTLFTANDTRLSSSSKMCFDSRLLSEIEPCYDVVWFLGSKFENSARLQEDCNLISQFKEKLTPVLDKANYVASSCTGVPLMLTVALIHPHNITCSWWLGGYLAKHFSVLKVSTDKAFVQSGKYLTSGATHCFQFIFIKLLEEFYHPNVLELFHKWLVIPTQINNQSQFIELDVLDSLTDKKLKPVTDYIKKNLADDLSNSALASMASMSVRTLIRTFYTEYGMTPGKYVLTARLERAMKLLAASPKRKVFDIAYSVGYQDIGALSKQFERHFGHPIAFYRKTRFLT